MDAAYPGSDGGDPRAVPCVLPETENTRDPPSTTLEVDGEVFACRPDGFDGTNYAWLSGPNSGYGFGASPTPKSLEMHRDNIRAFLNMVDPSTGYIEDD